jgi:hypothetical protein
VVALDEDGQDAAPTEESYHPGLAGVDVRQVRLVGVALPARTARQKSLLVTHISPRSSDERLDSEEWALAEAGLLRLPVESLPDSFWKIPAPRISFVDAVSAVTSERDES